MERYEKLEIIGYGSFGEVYKYKDLKNDEIVAIKWIPFDDKDEGLPYEVLSEISLLKELDHGNVVRLFHVVVREDGFYLVFEHLNLDLATFIDDHSKIEVDAHVIKSLRFQILQGVSYYHSQNVLHQDLKPDNLLIDPRRNTVKLAYYGSSMTFDVPLPKYSTKVTAPAYKSPELLLGIPYSSAVDIWSVGCIFAEMVTKRALFSGTCETDMMIQICRMFGVLEVIDSPRATSACPKTPQMAKLSSETTQNLADIVPGLETEGLDLLSKMLCANPNRRITAHDALRHPYFTDFQMK